MSDLLLPLPEVEIPGFRLGRSVFHDARSLQYKVEVRGSVTPKSVKHESRIGVLDQNTAGPGGTGLGTCTCHSGVKLLSYEPYWSSLPEEVQRQLTDQTAVNLYREVTRIDPFPGAWEPDDTGSNGLSVAKVLKGRGWISGYQTATTLDEYHTAIQAAPFSAGTIWFSGMDTPNSEGIVTATGHPRGGHQYTCDEYDAARDLWWFTNSWSPYWGKNGRFALDTPNFLRLMGMRGDVTTYVPLSLPAPTPTPIPDEPAPAPSPAPEDVFADFPRAQVKTWLGGRSYTKRERTARTALAAWFAAKGYDL